ncbi:MAG: hypothetical protein HRF40_11120 [Nitrososphaera sp.]|jgi:hypothetical protein
MTSVAQKVTTILMVVFLNLALLVSTTKVAAVYDDFPALINGEISIALATPRGTSQITGNESISAANYYEIQSNFLNPEDSPKNLSRVYFVSLVVDQYGYTHEVAMNTYGDRTIPAQNYYDFHNPWFPQAAGEYRIRTFLVSGLDPPQILTPALTAYVTVSERIELLGIGESNERIVVQNINLTDNSVDIRETHCVGSSYHKEVEATLHAGEHVTIGVVDVYFLGIEEENNKAKFRFEANSGMEEDYCLI